MKFQLFTYSLALALVGCGGSSSTSDSNSSSTTTTPSTTTDNTKFKLRAPSGDSEFATYLKDALIKAYGTEINYPIAYALAESTATTSADTSTGSTTATTSSTNLQEQNVDEADIIKTHYPYVFQLDKTKKQIKSLEHDETNQRLYDVDNLTLSTSGTHTLSGMYSHTDGTNRDAIVVSKRGHNIYADWFMPIIDWHTDNTELHWVNTSDASALAAKYSMSLDGDLISSRKVGSTLYMVMRHSPVPTGVVMPYSEEDVRKNKSLIEQASIDDLMPKISFNSQTDTIKTSDCYLTPYTESHASTTQIVYTVAIDVTAPTASPKAQCIAGNIEAVYASTNAMYLATTQYQYSPTDSIAIYPVSTITTDIHKFKLAQGDISYTGSGSIEGHLGWEQDKKSFRMGEHNDQLRVISYVGRTQTEIASPARLHILSETSTGDLSVTASLPNTARPEPLGKPGEQIYSTRFMGERAYLVTFRSVDPLYVLDLSNASDPFIAGELEIEGYSDYLHPINNQLLIGIGKDAVATSGTGDGNGAWYQGVKVALFDVSNPASPLEINKEIIGKRGSNTAVSYDHHAFSSMTTTDNQFRFALPVSIHNIGTDSGDPRTYYQWSSDNLYVYDVPLNGTASLVRNDTLSKEIINGSFTQSNQDDRSVLINNSAHYLLGGTTWH